MGSVNMRRSEGAAVRRAGTLAALGSLVAAVLVASAPHARAQPTGKSATHSIGKASPMGPTTHYWYDGGVRRPLRIDPDQAARFSTGKSAAAAVVVPAAAVAAGKAATGTDAVSPLLRDENGAVRALPGGVIVTLQGEATDDASARQRLHALGLAPVRPIGTGLRTWLVAAPAGLESLALANRLHEGGQVAAQPNWWQPRVRK